MSRRALGGQVVVWATCLIGLNGAVWFLTRNAMPRQVAARIDQSPPITDLFVGNSLMQAGLDARAFERGRPDRRALNISLGATSPIEHDALLRRALRLGGRRVYYGFFDLQLVVPEPGGWGDLIGNRAMAYYLEPETTIGFYAGNAPTRAALMWGAARFPLFVERATIWAQVERARRWSGAWGLPPRATNRFGRADDFRSLEHADPLGFRATCRAIVDRRQGLAPAIADMLGLVRRRAVPFICVEMPMPAEHRRRFYDTPEWGRLRGHLVEQVTRSGGRYLQASDWISDEGFDDDLHLNERGAQEFSTRLAASERDDP